MVDADGWLMDCNQGFRYLVGAELPSDGALNIRHLFVRPGFSDFRAIGYSDGSVVYNGIMNIGDASRQVRSIFGNVYLRDDCFLIVGEHDVADLERLNATVIELNEELAGLQRELVRANRELKRNDVRMQALMRTDPLTGVPNRRHFNERVADEISRSRRYDTPLTLAIADIDHFKHINDDFGHDVGDRALKSFSAELQAHIRKSDFLARFGGEEFVLLLPETDLDHGVRVVEKIRRMIAEFSFALLDRSVTASFGVAGLRENDDPRILS